jgi:hypothetical protein
MLRRGAVVEKKEGSDAGRRVSRLESEDDDDQTTQVKSVRTAPTHSPEGEKDLPPVRI